MWEICSWLEPICNESFIIYLLGDIIGGKVFVSGSSRHDMFPLFQYFEKIRFKVFCTLVHRLL